MHIAGDAVAVLVGLIVLVFVFKLIKGLFKALTLGLIVLLLAGLWLAYSHGLL